jgi:TIR domain
MTTVFVSSCRIDSAYDVALVERLRKESFRVLHSPRNRPGRKDERWREWYAKGCREEMERASIFIAVISPAWDCSTWMAHEVNEALKLMHAGKMQKVFSWNPERIKVKTSGMLRYVKQHLPEDLDELVRVLSEDQDAS